MRKLRVSEFLDKLLLLVAMLLFAWVGISAIFEVRRLDTLSSQGRPLLSEMEVNAPRYEATPPDEELVIWDAPKSQSRGEEWVFDVFTPPVIYYDPSSREFAVTPPNLRSNDDGLSLWTQFDLELLEVRLRPYRLQLVGYAGEPGSYVAYFERVSTSEIVLLREGEENLEIGVRLDSFQEERIETMGEEEETPVTQSIGVARLYDFNDGKQVSLTNKETKMFSDFEAKIRDLGNGYVHLVKIGDRIELENWDYLIEDLSVQPEGATVVKVSKDGSRRISRTLIPAVKTDPNARRSRASDPASSSPFSPRPDRSARP
ncbi:hypothetical protein [Pelagicoccus sp. SDUM812003]|uniref:hypothetical protein n=1 Tax=Pelagicoccus sp. SDUM812003 TaxID=3041267 RepID=UPI00280D7C8C|nr:hypothetical protein [Pelagicoccus sp. SDUM812003]MDQ8204476.1 hypothetical protein [Pelagicoccus sp. SDUM812003]